MLDRCELNDSRLLGITTANAFSNYLMTYELQSNIEVYQIESPALRNHIPCMAHVIQLAIGAFMSSLGVNGCTKSWEAHEHNQQFRVNESIDIKKCPRLQKEGNPQINKVSAMRPGLAKIIEKECISKYFESPETDLHIAENACCIDYTDTCSSKWVHLMSKSQSPHRSTTFHGVKHTFRLNTNGRGASLPITKIDLRVAPTSKIQWLPATLNNTEWMDYFQVHHWSFKAILILDHRGIKVAYDHIASVYHSSQWYVRSYGLHYVHLG